MDRHGLVSAHGTLLIDGAAENVHNAAQRFRSYRNRNAGPRVHYFHTATQAFGGAQANGAHHAVAQLLLDFQRELGAFECERVIDVRQLVARKRDVDHRADTLDNRSFVHIAILNSVRIRPNRISPSDAEAQRNFETFHCCICALSCLPCSAPLRPFVKNPALNRRGATDNLGEFLGDRRLAGCVVNEQKLFDDGARVIGCRLHRHHPGTLFRRYILVHRLIDN